MKKKLIIKNQTLRHVNGRFGFRAKNAYRERKKCVEKISKDFILQKNNEICRTDDLCMWRKQNSHDGVMSDGENKAAGQTVDTPGLNAVAFRSDPVSLLQGPFSLLLSYILLAVGNSLPHTAYSIYEEMKTKSFCLPVLSCPLQCNRIHSGPLTQDRTPTFQSSPSPPHSPAFHSSSSVMMASFLTHFFFWLELLQ